MDDVSVRDGRSNGEPCNLGEDSRCSRSAGANAAGTGAAPQPAAVHHGQGIVRGARTRQSTRRNVIAALSAGVRPCFMCRPSADSGSTEESRRVPWPGTSARSASASHCPTTRGSGPQNTCRRRPPELTRFRWITRRAARSRTKRKGLFLLLGKRCQQREPHTHTPWPAQMHLSSKTAWYAGWYGGWNIRWNAPWYPRWYPRWYRPRPFRAAPAIATIRQQQPYAGQRTTPPLHCAARARRAVPPVAAPAPEQHVTSAWCCASA